MLHAIRQGMALIAMQLYFRKQINELLPSLFYPFFVLGCMTFVSHAVHARVEVQIQVQTLILPSL